MDLKQAFHKGVLVLKPIEAKEKFGAKRPAPFSIRLTETEGMRLLSEASGAPLGTYIKAKVLNTGPIRSRRSGLVIEDRQSLAKILALLGHSRLSSNLHQLAHAASIGTLPITPETEEYLCAAARSVMEMRGLLISALGLKPEARP
jgi:hypothetical protein